MPTKEFFLARAGELKREYHLLEGKLQPYNPKTIGSQLFFIQGTIEVNLYFSRICP